MAKSEISICEFLCLKVWFLSFIAGDGGHKKRKPKSWNSMKWKVVKSLGIPEDLRRGRSLSGIYSLFYKNVLTAA